MNTKHRFILTAAVIVTSAIAIGISSTPFQTAVADAVYCASFQGTDVDFTFCSGEKELVKTVKDDCKDLKKAGMVEKCSSSRTGFGERTPNQ